MGFLENLWDDTLAGPAPDSDHGRKLTLPPPPPIHVDDGLFVTRRIRIVRTTPSSAPTDPPSQEAAGKPSHWGGPRSLTVYDWIVISALDR